MKHCFLRLKARCAQMNYKSTVLLLVSLIVGQLVIQPIQMEAAEQKPTTLMLYMTYDGAPNEKVLFWEATFSAFAKTIHLMEANKVDPSTINEYDVIVFIGDEAGDVPTTLRHTLEKFSGKIIAFGHNAEQLPPFNNWEFLGEEIIRTIENEPLQTILPITEVIPPKNSDILSTGHTLQKEIPLVIKNGLYSFIASTSINEQVILAVSRTLYTLLHMKPPKKHPAYIRLEDISPVSDPTLVKAAGEYLIEHNIPFYIALIPVYVNSETGTQIHLAENKELVQVLHYLQSEGGMIIAHGYTHSYRSDETGEGFEFWDVQLNQQITSVNPDEPPIPLNGASSYPSEKAYEQYKDEMNQIERAYIDLKHTKAIEQLVDLGLYPISFEAPHYTMSAHGYAITANYFPSIFGQLQLSDSDWQVMNAPLFISNPALLAGMTLYPETIGFIDPMLADPLAEMERSIHRLQNVPGSVIGGFYHPYIGLEYLPKMVHLIEKVGNIEWIDLRDETQTVQTKHVTITQESGKPIQVSSTLTVIDRMTERIKEHPFESFLWLIVAIVLLFILAFFMYISRLRIRLKKRLFEEREQS